MKALLNDGTVQEMEDGLSVLRHTTSHVLAQAVKRLYPETKLAIGPSIAEGFYYDMDREGGFTEEDLEKIEAEMKKIVKENLKLETSSRISRKTPTSHSTNRASSPTSAPDPTSSTPSSARHSN